MNKLNRACRLVVVATEQFIRADALDPAVTTGKEISDVITEVCSQADVQLSRGEHSAVAHEIVERLPREARRT